MENLPQINKILSKKPLFIEKDYFKIDDFYELKDQILDIVNGSCMAMAIDDEVIWNEYCPLNYKEKFLQNSVRDYICNNINSLFFEIFKKNKNTRLYFYLYEHEPLLIIVFYNAIDEDFIFKFFN